MRKKLLLLSFIVVSSCSLIAQTYVYNFADFTEAGAVGPTLTEVNSNANLCIFGPTTPGAFNTQLITSGCGTQNKVAFDFNQGGGVQFDNSTALIGNSYTISMVFAFDNYPGGIFQRLVDVSEGTRDGGLYIGGSNTLELDGAIVVGAPYTFTAGTFAMVTLVRDDLLQTATTYINGVIYSVADISGGGDPFIPGTFFNFFRDDDSGPCDEGAGTVSRITVRDGATNAAGVLVDYAAFCLNVLPLHLLDFTANKVNSTVSLKWVTENEQNASHFEIERSADGRSFARLNNVTANNNSSRNNYSFVDAQPLTGVGFYRIKMMDTDGRFKYSNVLKINFTGKQSFEVYPNPVRDVLTISGIQGNKVIKLLNLEGRELTQKISSGQSTTLDMVKYPPGVYIVVYSDGETIQRQKVVKN